MFSRSLVEGGTYDPQSPQKYLLAVVPLPVVSVKILGVPVISMALVGVGRLYENLLVMRWGLLIKLLDGYDTHSDPPEAWQLKQWQSPAIAGNDDASIFMPMAPQLQAPWILSVNEVIFK